MISRKAKLITIGVLLMPVAQFAAFLVCVALGSGICVVVCPEALDLGRGLVFLAFAARYALPLIAFIEYGVCLPYFLGLAALRLKLYMHAVRLGFSLSVLLSAAVHLIAVRGNVADLSMAGMLYFFAILGIPLYSGFVCLSLFLRSVDEAP